VELPFVSGKPVFPKIKSQPDDPFLVDVNKSGKSWVVIVDPDRDPQLVLRTEDFIREALFSPERFRPLRHCHRPIIVRDEKKKLGELITRYRVRQGDPTDDIVEDDVILLWSDDKRVVTGTDILGRLLRGIARKE